MKFLIFLCSVVIFSSCAKYNKNPVTTLEPNADGGVDVIAGNQAKVKNVNITKSYKEEVNGRMIAKVEVQNRSSRPVVFGYKFNWVNADGSVDSSTSTWQTATINGQEIKTLQDVDLRGNAVDFRILLKAK